MADVGISLWNVQKFDQTIGVYTNLEAAEAHGEHLVHAHYQDAMDRSQVPESFPVKSTCRDLAVVCGGMLPQGRLRHWRDDAAQGRGGRTNGTTLL